ncbi:Cloroperoxidase, partial [Exidia glandulosa HHB12029]
MFVFSLAVLSLGSLVVSRSVASDIRRSFVPPGPGDSRSPCPLLNALANENIMPHTGQNIPIALLNQTMREVLNLGADLTDALVGGAQQFADDNGTINLHDLATHNVLEHDASLVHDDAAPGAVYAPTDTNKAKVAAVSGLSTDGVGLTARDLAHARVIAEETSLPLPDNLAFAANVEAALALTVIGDGTT